MPFVTIYSLIESESLFVNQKLLWMQNDLYNYFQTDRKYVNFNDPLQLYSQNSS